MIQAETWRKFYEPKYGRPVTIIVWKNRDFDTPGKYVTIDPSYLKAWSTTLDYLTLVVKPKFGAVRKIFFLDSKQQIHSLLDITPGGKYLLTGTERPKFKKDGYLFEKELNKIKRKEKQKRTAGFHPITLEVPEMFYSLTKKKRRTVIHLMVSGRNHPPLKIVLIDSDLDSANIMKYLEYRLDVGEGIKQICKINGEPITTTQMKHGGLYVAVPSGSKFIKLDYKKISMEQPMPTPTEPDKKKRKRKRPSNGNKNCRLANKIENANESQNINESSTEDRTTLVSAVDKEFNLDEDDFDVEWEKVKKDKNALLTLMQGACLFHKCQYTECHLIKEDNTNSSVVIAQEEMGEMIEKGNQCLKENIKDVFETATRLQTNSQGKNGTSSDRTSQTSSSSRTVIFIETPAKPEINASDNLSASETRALEKILELPEPPVRTNLQSFSAYRDSIEVRDAVKKGTSEDPEADPKTNNVDNESVAIQKNWEKEEVQTDSAQTVPTIESNVVESQNVVEY